MNELDPGDPVSIGKAFKELFARTAALKAQPATVDTALVAEVASLKATVTAMQTQLANLVSAAASAVPEVPPVS